MKKQLEALVKVSEKTCKIDSMKFDKETRFFYTCSSDEDSSDCELKSLSNELIEITAIPTGKFT